jgi:HTH-type transcriptional regulator, glycine betaine synthesis regulator
MVTASKEELIEELGVHFESLYHLPPLACRIYSILILNGYGGMTFEELIEQTEASKSSVSTSINLLMQTDKVDYFTKPGDRKRYFRNRKNHLKLRLSNYKSLIEREIDLFGKTSAYLKAFDLKTYKENLCYTSIYIDHLKESKKILEVTLDKLENAS